jgi:hypothetical protein
VFAACWIGVYVGLFTVARTKLPSYVTPCYPALALVTAAFLEQWMSRQTSVSRMWLPAALGTFMFIGLVVLVSIPFVAALLLPGEEWLAIAGLFPLAIGTACFVFYRREQRERLATTFAAGAAALTLFVFAVAAPTVDRHQKSHVLLEAIPRPDSVQLAAFGCLEPSWVFYNGKPIEELKANPGFSSHAWQQVQGAWQPKNQFTAESFVQHHPRPYIITSNEQMEFLEQRLPGQTRVVAEVPYFLKKRRLLVLECTPGHPRTASSKR